MLVNNKTDWVRLCYIVDFIWSLSKKMPLHGNVQNKKEV
jgi:hypothetical protein